MAKTISLKAKPHCYVCGKEIEEDDIIEGPDLPILCDDCFIDWQNRCYLLLEQMKEERQNS